MHAKHFANYELIDIDGKLWVKDPYTKEHEGIHHDDHIIDNGTLSSQKYSIQLILLFLRDNTL